MAHFILRMLSNEKFFTDAAVIDPLVVLRSFCALVERGEIVNQHYMPETDNLENLSAKENQPKRNHLRWVRGLTAAAAVLAIVIFGSVTAKAFGVDVWKAVIQWTQETFQFGDLGNHDDGPNEGNNLPYSFSNLIISLISQSRA